MRYDRKIYLKVSDLLDDADVGLFHIRCENPQWEEKLLFLRPLPEGYCACDYAELFDLTSKMSAEALHSAWLALRVSVLRSCISVYLSWFQHWTLTGPGGGLVHRQQRSS